MAATVHANAATPEQLRVLLSLSDDEVRRVIDARPFHSAEEFRRALPIRAWGSARDVAIPKLDINTVSEQDIQTLTGASPQMAGAIVAHRPYYVMLELRPFTSEAPDVFARLTSFFSPPSVTYSDKLTGRDVALAADPSQVLVRFKDDQTEAASSIARTLRLRTRGRGQQQYQVFAVPESESGTDVLNRLKGENEVERVVPAFTDRSTASVFLDPAFCVVQFTSDVPSETQAAVIAELGLEIHERHRTPGLVTVRIPGASGPGTLSRALSALNGSPAVKFAEPAYIGVNDLEFASPESPAAPPLLSAQEVTWNLALIDVPDAWQYGTGSADVIVAVIDTGIDPTHPAIQRAILPRPPGDSWNFADDMSPDPDDSEGHGTFIAGLLVGDGTMGVRGVCSGCRLLPLKVPVTGATMSYARRRDAILYALELVSNAQRLVLNISWKTTGDVALIRDAINTAVSRSAVVVCSAGNWPDAPGQPHYPSDYLPVLSVGAVGPDRLRAEYSFYGAAVDLAAPGGSGSTLDADNLVSAAPPAMTAIDFGTSFAAPHVAGAAALLLSHDTSLPVSDVRQLLEGSATPMVGSGLGNGLVNVGAAIRTLFGTRPDASLDQPAGEADDERGDATNGDASANLRALNEDSEQALVARFAIAVLTARLIVAHRPYDAVEDIRGTLGLTEQQYERIAAG